MGYTLTEYRAKMRTELSDAATFWSDGELDRGVEKAEHILNRLIPKRTVVETTIGAKVTDETLAIATNTGTTTYKPIKYHTDVLTSTDGATSYTRDTNYTINYITGVITEITGLADGDYYIDYELNPQMLDVSSLISNLVKIVRIEYPVGQIPASYVPNWEYIDGYILFGADVSLTSKSHIRIFYDTVWTAAAASTDGEYPDHLSNAVIIGACGQALLLKAEKYVQSSITAVAAANTAISSMATPLADINTALDAITTPLTDAETALDAVILYLSNNTNDDAAAILANVTDDIAELRTAIETALDKSSTYLTNATTPPSAHDYLVDGDDFLNVLTHQENVAANYIEYSRASMQLYAGLIQEAATRLSNLRSYIEESQGWVNIANGFNTEASQRISIANANIAAAEVRVQEISAWAVEVDKYISVSQNYLEVAGRYLASGQSKINEYYTMLGFKPEIQHILINPLQNTNI